MNLKYYFLHISIQVLYSDKDVGKFMRSPITRISSVQVNSFPLFGLYVLILILLALFCSFLSLSLCILI